MLLRAGTWRLSPQLRCRFTARTLVRPCSSAASSQTAAGQGAAPADAPAPAVAHPPAPLSRPAGAAGAAGLSEQQWRQLEQYLDHMLEVNKVMNLTAVRERKEAWERHIMDSLALLPVIEAHVGTTGGGASSAPAAAASTSGRAAEAAGGSSSDMSGAPEAAAKGSRRAGRPPKSASAAGAGPAAAQPAAAGPAEGEGPSSSGSSLRLIDVGTGAGLPGMVLAIARPHWKVTLLDSLRKRCDFLAAAAQQAGVANVDVVWARAEEAGQRAQLRHGYDLAIARAVAETRVLAELCLPFVRVGGLWVAAKGPEPQAEVDAAASALKLLGGRLRCVERVQSFSQDGSAQLTAVVVNKAAATPGKFPRSPGTPGKTPL